MNLIPPLIAAGFVAMSGLAFAHGKAQHATSAPVAKTQQAWGVAGEARQAARTVTIEMGDNMRFVPDRIEVRRGETVRFAHHNGGQVMHEFVIGTPQALAEHAALMEKFPEMEHEEPWMAHVPPGGRGEVVWTFNRPGTFEFACLIPGHYQAGMVGTVVVVEP